MPDSSPLDQSHFRRMLARNIAMPLSAGLLNIVLFVALVFALLSSVRMVDHTEAVIRQANAIINLAMDMQSGVRGYLITGDEDFLQAYENAKPAFASELKALQESVQDNPVQVERLRRVELAHQEWLVYSEQVIGLYRSGGDYAGLVRSRGKSDFGEFRRELFEFKNHERELLSARDDQLRSIGIAAVVVYLLVSCLVTGILGYLGRRELILLSNTYTRSFEESQRHAQLLEQQAWQRSGQARLAEKCMGQTALPVLGRTVLDFLAGQINSAVGALYVREADTGVLQRVATYGVGKEIDQEPQSFGYGESLVEQALFSRRPLQLDDVPENYLKINTGLGSTSPRHIILVPAVHDGEPNGVIELGFLNPPAERDLEFLRTVSANIGTTIEAALYRRRLQDALEQTQQLNEELQVQQEELRTANEELEEQSRVLEESQALLENQKAELEQTNEKLVEQAISLDDKNRALNRAQEELEERAADLQKASKYKSEFLANMSHELRTPLNSSMILAKILAENGKGNLDQEQIQFARSIYSAGNDLLNLINDILDISKVEAGKLELRPEYIDLRRLTQDLELTFQPLAAQKRLELSMAVASPALSSIVTDRQRLEQILKNLMSNALKFTERGQISLAVEATADGRIAFAVTDTGIGIAPDQQEVIFEAFQQGEGGINRRYGGTGLGLSISRDLAALLGGDIQLHSTPGKGSTFTLYLPAELSVDQPQEPSQAPVAAAPVRTAPAAIAERVEAEPSAPSHGAFADDRVNLDTGERIVLVVEDDLDFARILYNLAHDMGYQCVVAANANEGMRLAAEFSPDAILLDIGLPDVSGMTVLQKLKRNSDTRHIPVHIISASDRMEAALQMGAVGYAVKPTTRESLQQMFEKIEEKLTRKMKRVLLVEDDPLQRESIRHLIGEEDIEITAVETGAEAMELLRDTIFDCMIIDLKLPDMQGNDLLRRMSSEAICSFPPVIVYTGRNLTRDEEHELLKYSRSIIIKGARSPERLLDEVTLFLHKVESDLSTDRQKMLRTVRSRDSAIEGRRILLVDDDVRNIFALTGALEQKGATVVIARDGFEAVEKVNSVEDIDVVLMDIMMPGMDGLEATRRIRSNPRFQKLPIIAITAKAMKDDQEQCLKAGASDYLAKPIDIDRLYSLLRVWIPNMERI
ncbi:MAG: response regulator [Cellvibrionaceae bacterium]|nr:response regulator [Cellvibrionaceae bacterium]